MESSTGQEIELRTAQPDDHADLHSAFAELIAAGEGFPQTAPLTKHDFDAAWVNVTEAVVAHVSGEFAGAYVLKPNQPGRGSHVANCGYFIVPEWRGVGLGRKLVVDSLSRAKALGFAAIQFNLVFDSNPARSLYEELGFKLVGTIPDGVHTDGGFEDAHVYWRSLEDV